MGDTKREKVAIVGFTEHRSETPWDDLEFDIWGLNGLYVYKDCRRFTRWFDLHPFATIGPERIKAYGQMPITVMLQEPHPEVPRSVTFPKAAVERGLGTEYFTNSISWMVGLAICENYREIHIYGVDMAQDTEYRFQRANLEYICGIGKGMGRKIVIATGSDLVSATHQYGYGTDSGLRKKYMGKLADISGRMKALDAHIEKATRERLVLQGAGQQINHFLQSMSVADHTSMIPDHPDQPEHPDIATEPKSTDLEV